MPRTYTTTVVWGTSTGLHELIGNIYYLTYTIITVDPTAYPAIWLEITNFDKIVRPTEGRKWFELHYIVPRKIITLQRSLKGIQSTISGFVSIARKRGYKTALTKKHRNLRRDFQSSPTPGGSSLVATYKVPFSQCKPVRTKRRP